MSAGGARRVAVLGAAGAELAQALAAHFAGYQPAVIVDAFASAQRDALARCDAVLVMGLNRPDAAGSSADAALRQALAQAGFAYQVVYGQGPQRLAHALSALARQGIGEAPPEPPSRTEWTWSCEKCSDPECEHRLFRRLLA